MKKFCAFCGAEVAMHIECSTSCPNCIATYQTEMEAGLIPAGLPKEAYEFELWKYIRQRERDVVAGRVSEEDARESIAREVENAKKNYGRKLIREAGERHEMEKRRNERNGPTGFLI